MKLLRYLWALPNSVIGLAVGCAGLLGGGRVRVVDGTLEIHGVAIAWLLRRLVPIGGGAAAITLGHVVLGRSEHSLERCRAHERIHVRQYERWGLLFLPAYFVSSLVALLKGADPYRDNRFEREAFEAECHDHDASPRAD